MELVKTSDLRANLRSVLDRVNDDYEPVVIRRGHGRGVVILDAGDDVILVETLHLSPRNRYKRATNVSKPQQSLLY